MTLPTSSQTTDVRLRYGASMLKRQLKKTLTRALPVMLCTVLLNTGLLFSAPAAAYSTHSFNADVSMQNSSGKSRAAAKAKARYGGKVLSVTKKQRDGRTVYRVKLLLDSGKVKIVTVD